ncbi:sensor domain-containing protein [Streptomyces albicerus]|uniref:sensor domain-containing protein n=1 Tax=Streptomyces albicerus TaxID=2569859 RepID=UPI00384D1FD8
MRKTTRQPARATVQLARTAALAFGTTLFLTVLLITATAALAVVGAGLLPETVLLVRRIAGAKRRHVAEWTGRTIPEAYLPLDLPLDLKHPLRVRLRTAVHDPGTLRDLRWMFAHYAYGWLVILALPLWPAGLQAAAWTSPCTRPTWRRAPGPRRPSRQPRTSRWRRP